MYENEITEDNIRKLVYNFYEKIYKDEALGPIFKDVIGQDINGWTPHLEIMVDFWSSVMLTTGRYHGSPVKKHAEIPKFDHKLFENWLILFNQSAREIYTEDLANLYEQKSRNIARSLVLSLSQDFGLNLPNVNT